MNLRSIELLGLVSGLLVTLVTNASAIEIDGIEFPDGTISFADRIVSLNPGAPGPTNRNFTDPIKALGVPDYRVPRGAVALGNGGGIVLEFVDNRLTGSGNADSDLHIFEAGGDIEDTFVEISKDGITFVSIGKVLGATSSIDIDAFGFDENDEFRFVRLTDDPTEGQMVGSTVGADIDAVGAIASTVAPLDADLIPLGNLAFSDLIDTQSALVYWRFNESSGALARNDGTLGGSISGTYGIAASVVDDGLLVGSNDTAFNADFPSIENRLLVTDFPMPTEEITVSFLVQGDMTNELRSFVGYAVSGSDDEFLLGQTGDSIDFCINDACSSFEGIGVLDGSIHHVVATWRSDTGAMEIYIDGTIVANDTISAGTPMSANGVFALGQALENLTPPDYGFDADHSFVGTLDEFAVFDRVLSASEVQDQFLAASGAVVSGECDEFFVQFNSIIGRSYRIEDALILSDFRDFKTDIDGSGALIRFLVETPSERRFFRVVTE